MTRFIYASCKSPRPNWRRWISGGGAAALPFLLLVFVGQNACTSHACPGSRHSGTNLSLAVTLNLGCDSFSLRCCLSFDPHLVSGLLFKRKLRSSLFTPRMCVRISANLSMKVPEWVWFYPSLSNPPVWFCSFCICLRGPCWVSCSIALYLLFLKQSLSMSLEHTDLARQAPQWIPEIFLSLPPQRWHYRGTLQHPVFNMGAGNPDSGHHVCGDKTSLREPTPQPFTFCFWCLSLVHIAG